MQSLQYLEFEFQIDPPREDGLHPVSVWRSPAGEGTGLFDSSALPEGARADAPPATVNQARAIGQALFEALFQGEVGALLEGSRQRAIAQQAGLRLRLRTESDEVAALPWELLFDERSDQFLSLSQETPLVRYLPAGAPVEPLTVEPPLRILGVVAAPGDLPPVNVEAEKARLVEAVGRLGRGRKVEVVWMEGQTWRALQAAMQAGPWHIVHYVGHARVGPESGAGELLLANEQGQAAPLGADEFGSLVEDHQSLRLVVLNACEGARSDEGRPFASIAATLVRSGLPAVAAMQYEITTAAAGEFTRAFYGALAEGLAVDAAMAEARKAMRLASPATVEWATPVLFLRSPDGMLFAPQLARLRTRRYLLAGAVSLLLLLALWALIYWVALPTFWPTQMDGFGIAVAGIGVMGEDGRMRQSDVGDDLSLSMFQTLDQEWRRAQAEHLVDGVVTVWHDSQGRETKNVRFGPIEGLSEEDRRKKAADLANRIGAEVVVYGYLTEQDSGVDLQVEFYHATPIESGEPAATAGNLRFGEPIVSAVPLSGSSAQVEDLLVGPANLRARMLYWITRSIILQLNNKPDEALNVLTEAYDQVTESLARTPARADDPRLGGLELVQLFRGSAALNARHYITALASLDDALRLQPDYVNALMLKGNVYTDRSQVYYVQEQEAAAAETPEHAAAEPEGSAPEGAGSEGSGSTSGGQSTAVATPCPQPASAGDAPEGEPLPDKAGALDDAREGVRLLEQAAALAPKSPWPEGETFVRLNLGIAYRALGMALAFDQQYDQSGEALEQAAEQFDWALARISPERQPQYVGWTQAGLGLTRRLQSYLATVKEFYANKAQDDEAAGSARAEAIAFLDQAITAFDVCLAQGEREQGNLVFVQGVVNDACVPYACEARQSLAALQAEVDSAAAEKGEQQ